MATYGDLAFDSRVQREAISLAEAGHRVTLLCVEPGGDLPPTLTTAVTVISRYPTRRPVAPRPIRWPGPLGLVGRVLDRARWMVVYRRDAARWGRWAVRRAGPADVWHVHDFPALSAIVPRLAAGTTVVYDSHEVFLESGTAVRLPGPIRAWLRRQEIRLAGRAAALITVNDACAEALAFLRAPRTVVVHNYPPIPPDGPAPDPGLLRGAAGIPAGAPVVISHGAITVQRGLEQLVDAVTQPRLEDVHLVFLGFGDLGPDLIERAAGLGIDGRVHVLPAVAPDALIALVGGADVAAMPIQPTTLNHVLSTPNKLFESLAAGVPVVASDFPGMARIVLDAPEGPLGAVCDPADVASIAAAIDGLLRQSPADRDARRMRCRAAARDRMSWPHAAARLTALYDDLAAGLGRVVAG